jgi:hypothetical protein
VQKRYVRYYIDARLNFGEFLIPVMVIVLVLTLVPQFSTNIQIVAMLTLYLFLLFAIIDAVVVGQIITRKLAKKFGSDKVERVRWYAAMRSFQLRVMRLPKPQVKRRQFPV